MPTRQWIDEQLAGAGAGIALDRTDPLWGKYEDLLSHPGHVHSNQPRDTASRIAELMDAADQLEEDSPAEGTEGN